jgi:hypothetical protein
LNDGKIKRIVEFGEFSDWYFLEVVVFLEGDVAVAVTVTVAVECLVVANDGQDVVDLMAMWGTKITDSL